MKNLKKILALVLALMMVMSMMVTASAVSFEDAESIQYAEAVAVLSEAGILNGYKAADGTYTFNPKGTLTRAEATKLIAYITSAGDLKPCETVFDDVASTYWAAGFIAYCYEEGYVDGMTETEFKPAGTLTVQQYAKLLLGVLGIEGEYTGAKWYVDVRNNAKTAKLMTGIESYSWTADLTREEAAQMTINAMLWSATETETGMFIVAPSPALEDLIEAEDPTALAKADLIAEAAAEPFVSRADALVYMQALNLTLVTDYVIKAETTDEGTLMANFASKVTYVGESVDTFGRPLENVWADKNGEYIYADALTPVASYTGAVTDATIKADLGVTTLPVSNVTANGKLVEYYVTAVNPTTGVKTYATVAITYTVDQIEVSEADEKGNVYYKLGYVDYCDYADNTKVADTIVLFGDIADDDVVTYVVKSGVAYVYPTETIEGILSRKTATGEYLTIGGEKIAVASGVTGATAYNSYTLVAEAEAEEFVLDQFGYVVCKAPAAGASVTTPTIATDYLYVLSYQAQAYAPAVKPVYDAFGNLTNAASVRDALQPKVVVEAVLTDGTYGLIELQVYTKDVNKDGKADDQNEDLIPEYYYKNLAGTETELTADIAETPVNSWLAYVANADETITLYALNNKYAKTVSNVTLPRLASWTDGAGRYTTSSTVVTGLELDQDEETLEYFYAVTSFKGLVSGTTALDLTAADVLVTYAPGSSYITNVYSMNVPVTTTPIDLGMVGYATAKGDQVANGFEWTLWIKGEAQTVVVSSGDAYVEDAVYVLTKNTAEGYEGTYIATAQSVSTIAKVTVADTTFYALDNGTTDTYGLTDVVYNATTGAADVIEVGDYVVSIASGVHYIVNPEEYGVGYYVDGTTTYVYSAKGLFAIAAKVNDATAPDNYSGKTIELIADIDLANKAWTPIGKTTKNGDTVTNKTFYGNFDGNGYTISNLKVTGNEDVALFGTTNGSTIQDLTIKNVTITGNHCGAALVGSSAATTITNVIVENAVITLVPDKHNDYTTETKYDNGDDIGAIAGVAGTTTITNCSATNVQFKGYRDIGGLVGTAVSSSVVNGYVENAIITVDQVTGFYEVKDANANEIIGRNIDSTIDSDSDFENVVILK